MFSSFSFTLPCVLETFSTLPCRFPGMLINLLCSDADQMPKYFLPRGWCSKSGFYDLETFLSASGVPPQLRGQAIMRLLEKGSVSGNLCASCSSLAGHQPQIYSPRVQRAARLRAGVTLLKCGWPAPGTRLLAQASVPSWPHSGMVAPLLAVSRPPGQNLSKPRLLFSFPFLHPVLEGERGPS